MNADTPATVLGTFVQWYMANEGEILKRMCRRHGKQHLAGSKAFKRLQRYRKRGRNQGEIWPRVRGVKMLLPIKGPEVADL